MAHAVSAPSNIVEKCACEILAGALSTKFNESTGHVDNQDLSLIEQKIIETEKVLNSLISAQRNH